MEVGKFFAPASRIIFGVVRDFGESRGTDHVWLVAIPVEYPQRHKVSLPLSLPDQSGNSICSGCFLSRSCSSARTFSSQYA